MFAFIKKLFETQKHASASKPRSARLGVEVLEDRVVMSASSASVHAVMNSAGQSVAFYKAGGDLMEKTGQGNLQSLGSVSSATTLSAGLDFNGNAEVYTQASPGANIEFLSDAGGGWQSTNAPISFQKFAAVKGGRMYALGYNDSVWEFQSPYSVHGSIVFGGHVEPITISYAAKWTEILGPNSIMTTLDAVTDINNRDMIFGTALNGYLSEYLVGTSKSLLTIGKYDSNNFSAGLDTNGLADVFIVVPNGDLSLLVKWSTGVSKIVFDVLPSASISATTGGDCFFTTNITYPNPIVGIAEYSPSGVTTLPPWTYNSVTQMSAPAANDVFAIDAGGTVGEYGALVPGHHWWWYN